MRKHVALAATVLVAACSETAAPPQQPSTTASIAPSAQQIQDTLQRCKENRAAVGDAVCREASEAYRKRFMGSGSSNYEPKAVDLFPQTADKSVSKATLKSDTRAKE